MDEEEIVGYIQSSSEEVLEKAVQAAQNAKKNRRKLGQAARGQYLFKVANIIEENLDDIAETMTREMGKTLPDEKGETARCVAILLYYYGECMKNKGDVTSTSDNDATMITKRTRDAVVGIITHSNFPVAIPICKNAPALVYGNAVVFKPATESAITAAKIVDCFAKAGLPEGVINFITGSGSVIGESLINHPLLDAITFTGSDSVGNE